MKNKPQTTLFMLQSVDGKISTGDSDLMDVDQDLPKINGLKEGLQQYYDLELRTDLFSLNSGRVFAKIGFNDKTDEPKKIPVTFIVIDNKPHLNEKGIIYLSKKAKKVIFVTTNHDHPALHTSLKNIQVITYQENIDFMDMMSRLKTDYSVDKLTIQSGGTLNAEFLRKGLIDKISLVVAPVLIGGRNTSSLIDGESLHTVNELFNIKPLKLINAIPLEHSYLHLEYKVINESN